MKLDKYYQKFFSEGEFWQKLRHYAQKIGLNLANMLLLLYFALRDEDTPWSSKILISAALGYFVLPTDILPDLLPGLGFTDDASMILLVLNEVSGYIKPDHREQAVEQLTQWFGEFDEEELNKLI